MPVWTRMAPPSVDLPASTWPMKMMLTCSLPYISLRVSSSTSALCSCSTAAASRVAALGPARDGLDRPEEGVGDVFPEGVSLEDVFSPVFSMALAAVTLEPSSGLASSLLSAAAASFFGSSFAGAVPPIVRTLAFGLGASPPMLRTFVPPSFATVTLADGSADAAAGSVGRFAMVGVCLGACDCCWCCWCWPCWPCWKPWYWPRRSKISRVFQQDLMPS